MRGLLLRPSIALLTFVVGVAVALCWHKLREPARVSIGSAPQVSQQAAQSGSLRWYAQQARAEGKDEAEMFAMGCGVEISSLDQALRENTVVVAEAVDKRSYPSGDYGIVTWYKFKVVETLSKRPMLKHWRRWTNPAQELPSEMLPVRADEFLMAEGGGTVMVEGVRVREHYNSPQYKLSEKYLLFLQMDDANRIGFVPWSGEIGVFRLDASGNLSAIDDEEYALKAQMSSRFGNAVERLRQYLKRYARA